MTHAAIARAGVTGFTLHALAQWLQAWQRSRGRR